MSQGGALLLTAASGRDRWWQKLLATKWLKEACYEGCCLITSVDEEIFEAEVS
jgi:hypothetical protein